VREDALERVAQPVDPVGLAHDIGVDE